ncbi:MAG: hypothetical protein ACRDPE_21825, partial [Solirubrobacterales bacterium]
IVHRSKIPIFVVAVAALLSIGVAPAAAEDHFTPLSARVLHAPEPVRGGDGLEHLVYELVVSNDALFPPRAVTVRKVIATAAGRSMEASTRPSASRSTSSR